MAVNKILSVSDRDHLARLIQYCIQESKTQGGSLLTFHDCCEDTVYSDMALVRQLAGKDNKLLAHQLIQSFPAGEVTPEFAHRFACEFAEKNLPGYQYIIATHTDTDHINTHIIINSVNQITGKKFLNNQTTLANFRESSDELCRLYGLSVIQNHSGCVSLDKDTYELARKGKSWKVKLSNDLDRALDCCHNIDQFNAYLTERGYEAYWTNKNITVAVGDYRIRLDTLARQFGVKYCKANIERALGIQTSAVAPQQMERKVPPDETQTEAAKIERFFRDREQTDLKSELDAANIKAADVISEKISGNMPQAQRVGKRIRLARALARIFRKSKTRRRTDSHDDPNQAKAFQPQEPRGEYRPNYLKIENVPYLWLKNTAGRTSTIKIKPTDIPKFEKLGIFYSSIIRPDRCTVTFKSIHENIVAAALGIDISSCKSVEELREEKFRYRLMKAQSKLQDRALYKMKISAEQMCELDEAGLDFSYFRRGTEYTVLVFRDDLQKVCTAVGLSYENELDRANKVDNMRKYSELKRSEKSGQDKVLYRVVSSNDLHRLSMSDLKFAYFEKDDRFNVAFLQSELEKYQLILRQSPKEQSEQERRQRKNLHM
ncbi:MAG: relaxase/mobilization nuclease domain-containing protein [Acutalibacteraceae bacterium]